MSNFKERAFDILSNFAELVPAVPSDFETKGDYIYVEDPTGTRYVEVSFSDASQYLPQLERNEFVSIEALMEACLKAERIDDASEEFKNAIYAELDESFGMQYELAKRYLKHARTAMSALNQEAGYEILNVDVLDKLLSGATEFYESSRCW